VVKKISSFVYDIPDEFTERLQHAAIIASHRRLKKNPAMVRDFINSRCPNNLSCFFNLPGLDAVCADLNAFYGARF
jgi:hypothetical protein